MDTDLFQGALLALLTVGLVVLIALLATLGGIRKALERRTASDAGSSGSTSAPAALAAPEATEPQGAETPVVETTPAAETPVVTTPAAETQQAAAGTAAPAASGGPGQADTIRSVLHQHGLSGSAETTPQTTSEPVVDSVFASHADDPQEEPFQRDGRWWFRRGDELLLYNEGTGQWEPAPDSAAPASAAPAAAPAAQQTQPAPTTTTAIPVVADQVATFWKCPTCGAVNGSTAATCRMCFAARP